MDDELPGLGDTDHLAAWGAPLADVIDMMDSRACDPFRRYDAVRSPAHVDPSALLWS